jgi:hypothetical protein
MREKQYTSLFLTIKITTELVNNASEPSKLTDCLFNLHKLSHLLNGKYKQIVRRSNYLLLSMIVDEKKENKYPYN